MKKLQPKPAGKIRRDDLVLLQVPATRAGHPARLRRIVALVEVDGQEVEMTFLTNNLTWAASSVVALYKERWQIEVFFKQIKETLQLADFFGQQRGGGAQPVGPELCAAVGGAAGEPVAAAGLGGAAQKLWDSRRAARPEDPP